MSSTFPGAFAESPKREVIMQRNTILKMLAVISMGSFLTACKEETPTGLREMPVSGDVVAAALPAPFIVRAPLDAFFINQPSEMMIRSDARRDFVLQRLVTAPSVGGWHTHPGPSFGIVEEGEVMITRATRDGCVSTTYRKGEAYFEVANEVHRATVLGDSHAVEYKARFYTPVGAAFGNPAAAPDCNV
jgi:hypothetical protein